MSTRPERSLYGHYGIDNSVVRDACFSPPFDVQVPLLSLPIFRTTWQPSPRLSHIPRRPRPFVDTEEVNLSGWPRASIDWQGNPVNTSDRYRSLPLARFEALARIDGIRLLSLQVGPGTEQLATAGFPVTDQANGSTEVHSVIWRQC